MTENNTKKLGDRIKEWLFMGQEEIIRTSQLGKQLIKGSLLHDELKTAYQELGKEVFDKLKGSENSVTSSELKSRIHKIQDLHLKVEEEESKIASLKTKA